MGKDFDKEDTEKITRTGQANANPAALSICLRKLASGEATLVANRCTRKTNGSGLRLGRSRKPIRGIPAHRSRALWGHRRFRRSLKVDDFPGPVRLFLVALRAANIEDLRFSRSGSSGVAGILLQAGYDGWNGNRSFAMQANYPAECLMFGVNGHCLILA